MRFANQKSAVLILMITTYLLSSCKEKVETVEEITIENPNAELKEALTFYASFDSSVSCSNKSISIAPSHLVGSLRGSKYLVDGVVLTKTKHF